MLLILNLISYIKGMNNLFSNVYHPVSASEDKHQESPRWIIGVGVIIGLVLCVAVSVVVVCCVYRNCRQENQSLKDFFCSDIQERLRMDFWERPSTYREALRQQYRMTYRYRQSDMGAL